MSEFEFKDQLKDKSYAELLEMENVLANKILVNSSVVNPQVSGGKLIGSSLHIPNEDASVYSFHVDNSGNAWWGATTLAAAVAKVLNTGVATFTNVSVTGGTVATSTLSGIIAQANLNIADRGWSQTCVFSVTDADTVSWAAGVFTSADGTAYNIGAGNTVDMVAKTYIYLDIAVSLVAYQITTIGTTAVGVGKCMVATAQNAAVEATYMVLQGQGGLNIDAANIVAGSITANEIAATTITSGKMNVATLSSIVADLGTITAGTITTNTLIAATNVIDAETRFNSFYTQQTVMGSKNDGSTESPGVGGSIGRQPIETNFSSANAQSCVLYSGQFGSSMIDTWTLDYEFAVTLETAAAVTQDVFVGLNTSFGTTVPTDATDTGRHIGFFIKDAILYASNADGTTQTITDISAGITLINPNCYRFVYDAGTNIKFYVNEVLKATHTTNMPTGATNRPGFWFGLESQSGGLMSMNIRNNYLARTP